MLRRDYAQEEDELRRFLADFRVAESGQAKYWEMLEAIARRTGHVISVELDDLLSFTRNGELLREIERNTFRFIWLFARAVDSLLARMDQMHNAADIYDVLHMSRTNRRQQLEEERRSRFERLQADTSEQIDPAILEQQARLLERETDISGLPPSLLRRYELVLLPRARQPVASLRSLSSHCIGRLVVTQGMVTRVSDVKPLLVVATYTCDSCQEEVYQEVGGEAFTPLLRCPNAGCASVAPNQTGSSSTADGGGVAAKRNSNILHLQSRGSKFVKFQELRVQELADTVPMGHIPRGVKVHLIGELTRQASPGDIVTVAGVFLPVPFRGRNMSRVRASGALLADTYLLAQSVTRHKKSYSDVELLIGADESIVAQIRRYAERPNVYNELARSIAPEIYGHEDVKKALLLMMVGAPTRVMPDGLRIRGDINVCLMGDPGVAKSQLLKSVAKMSPRGVYTSGKGSSGVGLTAAVLKDPLTNDFVLEGGSLVLADMGVCCIDEFDKMSDADRTSIHEVMEQQTISVAKAGITTSLNARTSILAAANPLYGRYNPSRTPSENINLPAALLSRFDLLFLLLDKHDPIADVSFAHHVLYVHTHSEHPPLEFEPVTAEFLRRYISYARTFNPHVPRILSDYVVNCYVNMRERMHRDVDSAAGYITPRTLLAILRQAQALARLRLASRVERADIDEAMRLMEMSKASLNNTRTTGARREDNPTSAIYSIIRELAARSPDHSASYQTEILPRVLAGGFTEAQLEECLAEYERINVWLVTHDRATVRFVQ